MRRGSDQPAERERERDGLECTSFGVRHTSVNDDKWCVKTREEKGNRLRKETSRDYRRECFAFTSSFSSSSSSSSLHRAEEEE